MTDNASNPSPVLANLPITLSAINKPKRIALSILGIALLLYVAIVTLAYFYQESLIFHPVKLADDFQSGFADVVEEKILVNGATLSALHLRLPNPKGVVFFLHGNSGNLQSWLTGTDFYRRVNYDLFIIDYRGFGKSSDHIESEAQLHEDVRAAWNFIAPEYVGKKRVIYGRSLGTGLAAKLSADIQPDLTILVSPYSSLSAIAAERYAWLPSFINRYPMPTDAWLPLIKNPLVIEHGDIDSLIPIAHAERLKIIRPDSDLVMVKGAGHNDIHKFPQYLDTLAAHLTKL